MSTHSSRLRSGSAVFAALAAAALFSGCATYHHAPVYRTRVVTAPRVASAGYVHRQHDVVLVFDASWNGYAVRGRPGHYYYRGSYYYWRTGHWYRGARPGGPWAEVRSSRLPRALARHWQDVSHHEARAGHRGDRRDAWQEQREEHRDARQDRRDPRQDARREHRDTRNDHPTARREAPPAPRKDWRDARAERPADRHEARAQKRDEPGSWRDTRQAKRDDRKDRRDAHRADGQEQRESDDAPWWTARARERDHERGARWE